jgi:MFS family permease
MQVPSNMLINKIPRPSLYIALVMLLWGMISTLSGNTTNFAGMVAIRFCIGFVEAAFLPGALLILSKWYTRRELTLRNAILFCGNLISNAFSSLVGAAVLSNMEGVLGHEAWRWLYWIEGAATMVIAISAIFILPDLPHNSRGFTEEERAVAVLRMTEDVGEGTFLIPFLALRWLRQYWETMLIIYTADEDSSEQSPWAGLVMAVKDLKIYVMMLTFTAYVVGLSFNAFFPSLTKTLGFGYVTTLLMSAPPWAFACAISLANAWHADRTEERFWHIVGPIMFGMAGFVISMVTENTAARYVALFMQASSYAGKFIPPSSSLRSKLIMIFRVYCVLLLDLILLPPPPSQTRRRNRHDQRIFPTRKYRWQLRLEHDVQRLQEQLWRRDGHVRHDDSGVCYL